jgi:hypothetical protein
MSKARQLALVASVVTVTQMGVVAAGRDRYPARAAGPSRVASPQSAAALSPPVQRADPTPEELRVAAQERMRQDLTTFSREQLRAIEELYQSANRDLRDPAAKGKLEQLVDKYPASNRTGCAVLYLAQLSEGSEREAYLRRAMRDHADTRYGDGAQVGALARVMLAGFLVNTGRLEEARTLAEETVTLFPGAIDHGGNRIADALRRMKLLR